MEKQYTHSDMMAALCVWEEACSGVDTEVMNFLDEKDGAAMARERAITLGRIIDREWERLDREGRTFPESFDWEFVPAFIREALDDPNVSGVDGISPLTAREYAEAVYNLYEENAAIEREIKAGGE